MMGVRPRPLMFVSLPGQALTFGAMFGALWLPATWLYGVRRPWLDLPGWTASPLTAVAAGAVLGLLVGGYMTRLRRKMNLPRWEDL
jgi:hypothetical protein